MIRQDGQRGLMNCLAQLKEGQVSHRVEAPEYYLQAFDLLGSIQVEGRANLEALEYRLPVLYQLDLVREPTELHALPPPL
jgi:hypothetical protein